MSDEPWKFFAYTETSMNYLATKINQIVYLIAGLFGIQ